MRAGALVLKRKSWEPIIVGPAPVLELLVGLGLALLLTRIGRGRPIVAALLPSPPWYRR